MQASARISALVLALSISFAALAQAPALAPGEVELSMPKGGTYIGTVTNGIPDGKGFFQDADGMMYEGDVRMGQRTGVAEGVFPSGDRYRGEWKDGKPHGIGKMVFMAGGSYEGEWKNGERDGKGVMVFAGTGRRAEVRFVNDTRVDTASRAPSSGKVPVDSFALWEDRVSAGLRFPDKVAYGAVPLNRGFSKLTPEQQQAVRSAYPTLEEGDDPPYPTTGGRELYSALSTVAGHLELKGDIWVYVAVDANGKVTSVTTTGPLRPDIKRAIGAVAGKLHYTPARCGGQPCAGVWGVQMTLTPD